MNLEREIFTILLLLDFSLCVKQSRAVDLCDLFRRLDPNKFIWKKNITAQNHAKGRLSHCRLHLYPSSNFILPCQCNGIKNLKGRNFEKQLQLMRILLSCNNLPLFTKCYT